MQNSLPNIFSNEAYGPDGKRTQDVCVANTAGGNFTHLTLSSHIQKTLCGQTSSHISRAWFLLSGCKRCAKAALKRGIAKVTDTDGTIIDLAFA